MKDNEWKGFSYGTKKWSSAPGARSWLQVLTGAACVIAVFATIMLGRNDRLLREGISTTAEITAWDYFYPESGKRIRLRYRFEANSHLYEGCGTLLPTTWSRVNQRVPVLYLGENPEINSPAEDVSKIQAGSVLAKVLRPCA